MNRPSDSVRIALFDAEDPSYFLVLAEKDDPTNWKLTGGKFNSEDESPWDAANRELHEELGLDVDAANLQGAGQLINDDGVSARHLFAGMVRRSEASPSDEIEAIRWVTEITVPDSPNKAHMLSAVKQARTKL
jgi:8-oxo-dGTP pyrophosphatase MutT (NUDIX family)